MRTPRRLLAVAAIALTVAACSSSASAGWTFSPTQPPTPAPPAASGAAPTATPGASSPTTGGGGGSAASGTSVNLVAQGVAFDQTAITVPPNQAFTINFDNRDAGIPHNVVIHRDSPTGEAVFTGDIVTGPAQKAYAIGPLSPGTYAFVCAVHPNMVGTLTVGSSANP